MSGVVRPSLAPLLATTALGVVAAHAVDGTWVGGTSTERTVGMNWTSTRTVPDGTATFTSTGSTTVGSNGLVNIGAVAFTAAPDALTDTIKTNDIFSTNSSNPQRFNVGASMVFTNSSSASGGSNFVTYNVSGGAMSFNETSTAGTAHITNGGGTVDISGLTSGGMTYGSIEGAGNYVLGANTLTTGSFNNSTQLDAVISGTGGGLTKVGTGTLTLTGTNTYSGATTVSAKTLALSSFGSTASSSVVTVNATPDTMAASTLTVIATLAGNRTVQMGGTHGLLIYDGSIEFAGTIQSTGPARIEIAGGTQTLSGVNTYINATQIDGLASLALKGGGSIANSLYVAFAGAGATVDTSQTTSGASVSHLFSFGTPGIVALGSKTLTITGNSGTSFGGVIQDGGISGSTGGNLLIANGGMQQLYGSRQW